MAVTAILAPALTAGNSTDITVTTTQVMVTLYTVAGGLVPSGVMCRITKVNPSGTYSDTGLVLGSSPNSVTGASQLARILTAPGVYRVERPSLVGVTDVAIGVALDT